MAYDDNDDSQRRARSLIVGGILALESSQARAVREFILGDQTAVARLKSINDQVTALRAQLNTGA